ncbi:hypothetical protein M5K25_015130 [Dendrobium thyrsiflorum]|uniref:Uncharacterized protein n=1 Tax=Dendrobium thyrsiflorum TaxID=117978 RepID=A0ABD0UQ61_DENTH
MPDHLVCNHPAAIVRDQDRNLTSSREHTGDFDPLLQDFAAATPPLPLTPNPAVLTSLFCSSNVPAPSISSSTSIQLPCLQPQGALQLILPPDCSPSKRSCLQIATKPAHETLFAHDSVDHDPLKPAISRSDLPARLVSRMEDGHDNCNLEPDEATVVAIVDSAPAQLVGLLLADELTSTNAQPASLTPLPLPLLPAHAINPQLVAYGSRNRPVALAALHTTESRPPVHRLAPVTWPQQTPTAQPLICNLSPNHVAKHPQTRPHTPLSIFWSPHSSWSPPFRAHSCEGRVQLLLTRILELYNKYFHNYKGRIPLEIKNLSKLIRLDKGCCGRTGEISSKNGKLENLNTILLQVNDLAREHPPELSQLRSVRSIDLSNKVFTVEIPQSFVGLNNLTLMNLFN